MLFIHPVNPLCNKPNNLSCSPPILDITKEIHHLKSKCCCAEGLNEVWTYLQQTGTQIVKIAHVGVTRIYLHHAILVANMEIFEKRHTAQFSKMILLGENHPTSCYGSE